ncbi:hypothetical protein IB274_22225 [Pseudomonas sp. PDM18]|uniref:hypothetical protein n=1 Tax=Pseudomonas TaxID=286 RepID=UPI00148703E1|nr:MULTISPECIES: hypothetical protein [Pseudomonas]MBD9679442.1 hypothetical protein [Pseudomonas sp. PDM18]
MKKRKLRADLIEGRFEMKNYEISKAIKFLALLGALMLAVQVLKGDLSLVLIISHVGG